MEKTNFLEKQIEDIKKINITEDEEIRKELIKGFCSEFSQVENKDLLSSMKNIFLFEEIIFEKYGDDIADKLWEYYDDKEFNMDIKSDSNFLTNLFFLNYNIVEVLLDKNIFDMDNKKIKSCSIEALREKIDEVLSIKPINEHKNFIIDILVFYIFSKIDLKYFYTCLSSFIVGTKSNVMLLFKCLALFGLSLQQIEKKEDFLDGLMYIIGGVLRDHARSYLKTKGILQENLSYHKCDNHTHETHFFNPRILTTKECQYLENYFLLIMKEFLKVILSDIKFEEKWDDYKPTFLKFIEYEKMDHDDILPREVKIGHIMTLFITDFVFSFVTNFTHFDDGFKTDFKHFKEFLNYTVSFITYMCHDVNNLFYFAEKKKKLMEIECEKSEYRLKDSFNFYGLCLIYYFIFQNDLNLVNLHDEKIVGSSFLPIIIKDYTYIKEVIVLMILKTENHANIRFMKDYINFISDVIDKHILPYPGKQSIKILQELLYIEHPGTLFTKLLLAEKNKNEIILEIIKNSKVDQIAILLLILVNTKIEISNDYHYEILKSVSINSGILNPSIRESLKFLNIKVHDIKCLINDLENNPTDIYLKHKEIINEYLVSFS